MRTADRQRRHESPAVAVGTVLRVGGLLLVVSAVLIVLIGLALGRWIEPRHVREVTRAGAIPPGPRLQSAPQQDLAAERTRVEQELTAWRWTDSSHQFAQIPIERAMQLYAQQRASTTAAPVAAAPVAAARAPLRPAVLRPPPGAARLQIEQRLGAQLPQDLELRDAHGAAVRLSDLFQGRPSLLVLGYFACTHLCGVVRAGVAHALVGVARGGLRPGTDFNVLVASIDPAESSPQASTAQTADEATLPNAQVDRWHYLTGSAVATAALAREAGFGYLFDARNGEYVHAAGIVLLTPEGRVAQYLFGASFLPQTLRLALVQASRGTIGTLADRLLLLCCDYDASTGRYSVLIGRVLRWLGVATLLLLGALVGLLRYAEIHRVEHPP